MGKWTRERDGRIVGNKQQRLIGSGSDPEDIFSVTVMADSVGPLHHLEIDRTGFGILNIKWV